MYECVCLAVNKRQSVYKHNYIRMGACVYMTCSSFSKRWIILRSRIHWAPEIAKGKSYFYIFWLSSLYVYLWVCLVLVCMCVGDVEFIFNLESHCCSKQPSLWIDLFLYCTHSHTTHEHITHTQTEWIHGKTLWKKCCTGMCTTRTHKHTNTILLWHLIRTALLFPHNAAISCAWNDRIGAWASPGNLLEFVERVWD